MAQSIKRSIIFAGFTVLGGQAACALQGPVGGATSDGSGGTGSIASTTGETTSGTTAPQTSTGGGVPAPEPKCPYDGVPIDPNTLGAPVCGAALCGGGGHCLPDAVIAATFNDPSQADKLAPCDATSSCVPDFFIKNKGLFIPASCDSVAGVEGRCLSECLPDVQQQKNVLPQSSCQANERCVPCYDPQTLKPTDACKLSCDPGPKEPPAQLPKCCKGIGTCVPSAAVPADKLEQLGGDSFPPDQGLVCAPDVFIADQNYQPAACETVTLALVFGSNYRPGVCLPECLPQVANGIGGFLLGKDGCPDSFKCAPCQKPGLFGPENTGACDL